ATIVGAGFIGLELAEALNNKGIKVNVVDKESCCLPNNLSQDYSAVATEEVLRMGIKFHKNISVASLSGKDKVSGVVLSTGKKIPSDIVIFSVGVKPETALGKTAKLKIGYYGIKTDKTMRTNNKDIYALGDCVESTDFLTQKPTSSFLATTASAQAKVAALNISGRKRNFPGVVNPAITKIGNLSFGSVGINRDKALEMKIEAISGDAQGFTREKVYKGAKILKTRLVARKKDLRIIGAEIIAGECAGYIINMLTLAILNKNTAKDLAELQFSGHPPQIDVPANMHIIVAAEDILNKANKL
ncbi:MAG: FAD-dependent oxidoreductase, partial [Elusimicrobiota bacterium]|nr:FAD-dependent oxidoreductase [Elusimicrobiota bacterium]